MSESMVTIPLIEYEELKERAKALNQLKETGETFYIQYYYDRGITCVTKDQALRAFANSTTNLLDMMKTIRDEIRELKEVNKPKKWLGGMR
jgi:hypothetical protein